MTSPTRPYKKRLAREVPAKNVSGEIFLRQRIFDSLKD